MDSPIDTTLLNHQFIVNDPLHYLFDAVKAIAVQGYDEERCVIYWNKGSELLYGYTSEEALGQKLEDLIIPHDIRKPVVDEITVWLQKGTEIPASEITLRHKNGKDVPVFSSHVIFTNKYKNKQLYCIDVDLADVKAAQALVIYKERMLKAAFETIPDLFFLMDEEGVINYYHTSNKKNLYKLPKDFIGKPMGDCLPTDIADKFIKHIKKVVKQNTVECFEYKLTMPQGLVYFEARISHLHEYKQVVVIIRDITEQHKSAEIIKHHAYYDALTLLPNRFLALDRLSQLLREAERNNEKIAILFIDLDDFKKVNDTLGHEIGDKLLIESANRLNKVVRKEDTVGRLGGDEFIVLLKDVNDNLNVLTVVENLLKCFREPFSLDGRDLTLTLSLGIALYPDNGTTSSELLRNADIAMYQAKSLGRNTYSFFTKKMNKSMLRRLEIEEQMHGALERNEFEVHYQPKIDIKHNSLVGAEALLRWHNPSLGNITPDEFIPIAEHTGLIVPIGSFVIKQALNFLHRWQIIQQNPYTMAINISPRQFRDTELLTFVENTLTTENVSAKSIEFEITEGVLMNGQSYIQEALIGLNKLGIKLSMDDFGTGYSSLSYLRRYPFDVLKIDRSFVKGITIDKADLDLVKAIISMAHSLGILVVAEGVETKEQVIILHELNCDYLQGYYYNKPMTEPNLIAYSKKLLCF
ncbi:EAL domain-containing protein [Colwellia sp. 1_MG-2023]|uniref:sensor domain-containing protein n=1 Tax=unclassified Colwellia TaxID=196834 RepID=UPI001C081799|nr:MULTISPECIES: EAL domain-containing protein [unclassified Colwellia]MBU2924746.1 EAL domain-containing protein [Colwellia sp. C2M11]MDO6653583.1 EAL domain-containing protein [Colwellia sp. 3_MG-2023]MDO6666316.1 EAL domain-containing protein [Colwellia sp. 2_MG-2023]MDO6690772.1 EAL domain-containing protein [Colwellia sp. 1_MG-2023]